MGAGRVVVPACLVSARLCLAWFSADGWFSAHVAGESVAQRMAGFGVVSPWGRSWRSFWSLAPFAGGEKGQDVPSVSEEHGGRPRAEGTHRVWEAVESSSVTGRGRCGPGQKSGLDVAGRWQEAAREDLWKIQILRKAGLPPARGRRRFCDALPRDSGVMGIASPFLQAGTPTSPRVKRYTAVPSPALTS